MVALPAVVGQSKQLQQVLVRVIHQIFCCLSIVCAVDFVEHVFLAATELSGPQCAVAARNAARDSAAAHDVQSSMPRGAHGIVFPTLCLFQSLHNGSNMLGGSALQAEKVWCLQQAGEAAHAAHAFGSILRGVGAPTDARLNI